MLRLEIESKVILWSKFIGPVALGCNPFIKSTLFDLNMHPLKSNLGSPLTVKLFVLKLQTKVECTKDGWYHILIAHIVIVECMIC